MKSTISKRKFSILLADDGSEHARAAVSLLADLRLPGQTFVQVLRVFSPLQAAEHLKIDEAVEETCKLISDKGLNCRSEVVLGYPAEKIVEYSEQNKPDLILIGAKGLRSTIGILLGGVAQQVVEYACCPVLIVRAPYIGLSNVLITSDGSESSFNAIKYLGDFPFPAASSMNVIHVLPPPPIPVYAVEPMFVDPSLLDPWKISKEEAERRQKEEQEGEKLLATCCESLGRHGIKAGAVLKRGDAATEIIKYAAEEKPDLIVTGSRGLSQFKSWLMGSVSRKLVHYSNCSVLVVRSGCSKE